MASPQDFIIQPVNALGAYLGGVQAKQGMVEGENRNALLKLQQQYTSEQRTALQQKGQMEQQEAQRKQQLDVLTRLGQATKNIAAIPDPQARAQLWGQVVEQHRPIYGDMVDQFKDPAKIPVVAAMVEQEIAKWGAPTAGIDPATGKPAFGQVDPATGKTRIVQGFAPPAKAAGISLTTPDGSVVSIGGDAAPGGTLDMSKPTQSNLEQKLTNAQLGIDRLRQIGATYDPSFSTYKGRAGAWVSGVKDSAGMASPDEQKKLAAYSEWRANVSSNLSQTFNELSGAAVSPQEEVRLRAGIPNENDSPTQFKSKYDATMKRLAQVQARSYIMLKKGLTVDEAPPLEAVDNLIRKRGTELDQLLQQQGVKDKAQRDQQVVQQLSREFGFGK